MSLPDFSTQSALFATARLDGQFFAPNDRYRLFAQKIYPLLVQRRPAVQEAYCADNGRAGIEPVLLMGVSLLQYLEGMPDRQAVDLLRYHAGWNFALNRSLGEAVFHPTTLVYFRERLIPKKLSHLVFGKILDALIEAGLVARQGKQRLDSTQMFGVVSRMSRVDCVREALRLALQELDQSAGNFGRPELWSCLWERYVQSKLDYKAGADVLKGKLEEAGTDAALLLGWVQSLSDEKIGQGQKIKLLQRVFGEQFDLVDKATVEPKKELNSDRVQNPHEPEAHYSAKGQGSKKKEQVGYKVQVAESVREQKLAAGEPTINFITGIVTHSAEESDLAGARRMEAEQAAMGLEKPSVQYVDGAYVNGSTLAAAQEQGRKLMGLAAPAPHNNGGKYTTEAFQIAVEERKAICPAGKANTQCGRIENQQSGEVTYRFEWSRHCADCALRGQCVGAGQKHRSLVVTEHHTVLQARRQEQKTQSFLEEMTNRNAIEGTQSELVRAHGLRRARYRGLAKVRLQNYFMGAACNAKRWIKRMIWEMKAPGASLEPASQTG